MATILLVDDSPVFLHHLERMLHEAGHQVVATTDGRVAVAALRHSTPDLVLTDIYMPPPDGFEIMRTAAATGNAPVIVMSTNPLACDVFRAARALGAVAELQKPFTTDHLSAAITSALSLRRAKPAAVQPQSRSSGLKTASLPAATAPPGG